MRPEAGWAPARDHPISPIELSPDMFSASPSAAKSDGRADPQRKAARRAPRRRRCARAGAIVIAVFLMVLGTGAGIAAIAWPEEVQQAYGEVQVAVGEWRVQVAKEVPVARQGATGGERQLGWCNGDFIEMTPYHHEGVPPVWAAHNNCGGDVILPLQIGDQIDLLKGGVSTRHEVVDVRELPKRRSSPEVLVGLGGALALQTCFYGGSDVPMKFVGLSPVA